MNSNQQQLPQFDSAEEMERMQGYLDALAVKAQLRAASPPPNQPVQQQLVAESQPSDLQPVSAPEPQTLSDFGRLKASLAPIGEQLQLQVAKFAPQNQDEPRQFALPNLNGLTPLVSVAMVCGTLVTCTFILASALPSAQTAKRDEAMAAIAIAATENHQPAQITCISFDCGDAVAQAQQPTRQPVPVTAASVQPQVQPQLQQMDQNLYRGWVNHWENELPRYADLTEAYNYFRQNGNDGACNSPESCSALDSVYQASSGQ